MPEARQHAVSRQSAVLQDAIDRSPGSGEATPFGRSKEIHLRLACRAVTPASAAAEAKPWHLPKCARARLLCIAKNGRITASVYDGGALVRLSVLCRAVWMTAGSAVSSWQGHDVVTRNDGLICARSACCTESRCGNDVTRPFYFAQMQQNTSPMRLPPEGAGGCVLHALGAARARAGRVRGEEGGGLQ